MALQTPRLMETGRNSTGFHVSAFVPFRHQNFDVPVLCPFLLYIIRSLLTLCSLRMTQPNSDSLIRVLRIFLAV